MPFNKVDINQELSKRMEDVEFKEAYSLVDREYELIKEVAEARKEMNLTQKDVSEVTGMPQQVVSRMEKLGHSPTLKNFIKYIDALGLDIKIVKKM